MFDCPCAHINADRQLSFIRLRTYQDPHDDADGYIARTFQTAVCSVPLAHLECWEIPWLQVIHVQKEEVGKRWIECCGSGASSFMQSLGS
jgi:hypothetical protein